MRLIIKILTKTKAMSSKNQLCQRLLLHLLVVVPGQCCTKQQQTGDGERRVSGALKREQSTKGENPDRKSYPPQFREFNVRLATYSRKNKKYYELYSTEAGHFSGKTKVNAKGNERAMTTKEYMERLNNKRFKEAKTGKLE